MKPYIYIILFVTTIGALVSCHTTNKHQDSSPYDSSNVAPAGKDSNSTRPPADIDSLEAQINLPDSVFEDGSVPTTWKAAGFRHPQEFKRWLIKYKDWVKNDQIDSLAAHTHFPIHGAGNTNWFKEAYPHIYTTHVKAVVSRQRLNRIFRNGQGAMFGDGTVWFIEKGGKFWVNQING
jgi:hypothetical protein